MSTFQPAIAGELHSMGWTLLHSLWQASAVAAALAIVLQLIPGGKSNWRYAAACSALLVVWFYRWERIASYGGWTCLLRG